MSEPLSAYDLYYLLKRETVSVTDVKAGDLVSNDGRLFLVVFVKKVGKFVSLLDSWSSGTTYPGNFRVSRVLRSSLRKEEIKEMLARFE